MCDKSYSLKTIILVTFFLEQKAIDKYFFIRFYFQVTYELLSPS